jgi:AcrR family transcriptional regulator
LTDTVARRLAGAPPGPRQRDRRSAEILDAAAALFVEKGVAATSIDDIVDRAGVAKGTFYHYFRDRTSMLQALRERYAQYFADTAAEATGLCDPEDWTGRLHAWTAAVAAAYISSYDLHDAIFHDPAVCHRCAMGDLLVVQDLAALIGAGCQTGVWDVDDALATAVCMFHGLHGMVDEAIATDDDVGKVVPRLSRLFTNMVGAR